jgi:MFS superfamily sulfate permease-like transporter
LDVPALDMLAELNDELDDDGIRLVLARVHAATSTGLERSGLLARLGPDGVHDHVVDAARAVQGGREP